MSNNTKICTECLIEKDLFQFQIQNKLCKSCKNKKHYSKEYYLKHKAESHQNYLDNREEKKLKSKIRFHKLSLLENRPINNKKGRPKIEIDINDVIQMENTIKPIKVKPIVEKRPVGRPKKLIIPVEIIEISNDILGC